MNELSKQLPLVDLGDSDDPIEVDAPIISSRQEFDRLQVGWFWLGFSLDTSDGECTAAFKRRFGRIPARLFVSGSIKLVGPIE